MAKETKKFSAFKLFYDEIIYKDRINVAYGNIAKNLNKIKELTMEIRRFPKIDLKEYTRKLEKNNKKLKEQLYDIEKRNKALYEYFYIIYKTQVDICTEKLEDMPFIINMSFYEDYRLDNKTVEELENSKFTVPKYNSLEKKKIRDMAKKMSRFEYFIKLLKESKNIVLYNENLDKLNILMNVKYPVKENREEYLSQIDFGGYKKVFDNIDEIAKKREDYEIISDKMSIAYKKNFTDWSKNLDNCIIEYYDIRYKKMREEKEIRGILSEVNDISFNEYQNIINGLVEEKNRLMVKFSDGKFEPVTIDENAYAAKFKENLINSYFDLRYINVIDEDSLVEEFANRAISLYGLAEDLSCQIFEKIVFDAGHSPSLKRNNDVRSSIIEKIYELYDPAFLLTMYDKAKVTFEDILNKKEPRFIQEYNIQLIDKKIKYGFHGPLPSIGIIEMRVNERRKKFIVDNCITELKSKYDRYDTRNYDLSLVARELYINDMIELYDKMKMKIKSFNGELGIEDSSLMIDLQEFVVKDIFNKLNVKAINVDDLNSKYRDICHSYLNEKCMFELEDSNNEEINYSKDDFYQAKREFNKISNWSMYIGRGV